MAANPPDKGLGVVAINEEQLERMDNNSDKLHHLESSKIFLPPDELLVLRTHGGYHVVKIHDDMDKSIEQSEKCRVTTRCETNAEPNAHRHNTMVNNVQQRNMLILFAKNEEKRIKELGELGEVIPPTSVDHSDGHIVKGIVNGLTSKAISMEPAPSTILVEEPSAENNLDEVINDKRSAKLESRSVFHKGRSPNFDNHDVAKADEKR